MNRILINGLAIKSSGPNNFFVNLLKRIDLSRSYVYLVLRKNQNSFDYNFLKRKNFHIVYYSGTSDFKKYFYDFNIIV